MPDWIRTTASRWGTWWVLACVVALFALNAASESCRSAIARGEECGGISKAAYQDGDPLSISVFAAMIAGGFGLGYVQRRADTRPCPRCGERVLIGRLDCGSCGFDFQSVGR